MLISRAVLARGRDCLTLCLCKRVRNSLGQQEVGTIRTKQCKPIRNRLGISLLLSCPGFLWQIIVSLKKDCLHYHADYHEIFVLLFKNIFDRFLITTYLFCVRLFVNSVGDHILDQEYC